jgi:hypothetical protein
MTMSGFRAFFRNALILIGIGLTAEYVLTAVALVPFPFSWVVIALPLSSLIVLLFFREWKRDKLILWALTHPWRYDADKEAEKYLLAHRKEADAESRE